MMFIIYKTIREIEWFFVGGKIRIAAAVY